MDEQLPDENFYEAPQRIINLAQSIIDQFHPDLNQVNIAFVIRKKPSISKGRMVLGEASLIPEKIKTLVDAHFMIWIAEPALAWDDTRLAAILDHELCHCHWDEGKEKAGIRGHDIEEFVEIIERRGLWSNVLMRVGSTIKQLSLLDGSVTFSTKGKAVTISGSNFDKMTSEA